MKRLSEGRTGCQAVAPSVTARRLGGAFQQVAQRARPVDAGDAAISDDVRQVGQSAPDSALADTHEQGETFHRNEFLLLYELQPFPDSRGHW